MASKVLLLGYLPPPLVPGRRIEAAHYRTWQFVEGLLKGGHSILLLAGARGEAPAGGAEAPEAWRGRVIVQPFTPDDAGWRRALQQAHDGFAPDCIVAVDFFHALYATTLQTERPLWMDIYGDMLTIQQAAMYRNGSNRGLWTTVDFMRRLAQAGDHYSVCATTQQHLLVGQLSMAGRLNAQSFGHAFVDVVRPGVAAPRTERPTASAARAALALPEDAFIVLWCGGYNTWTDVDTLFEALEGAMRVDGRVHFVSVGGSTYSAPDNQYERLLGRISGSPLGDRFGMRGWQPWEAIPTYYAAADVGINSDALHYETVYGTRTRLLEMLGAGLPAVTSLGSELSYQLCDAGAALGFEIGRAEDLRDRLLALAAEPERRQKLAEAALHLAQGEFSFVETTEALRRWVAAPERAPDRRDGSADGFAADVEFRARAAMRSLLWRWRGLER